jgi:hypothetical protein
VRAAPALLAVALGGCALLNAASSGPSSIDAQPTPDAAPNTYVKYISTSDDLDLLLVVDDSPSIGDKQAVFASAMPKLVQGLDAFPGGRPNLHIGVIGTSVDILHTTFGPGCPSPNTKDDGRLLDIAGVTGCTPPSGLYAIDEMAPGGTRTTNYTGTLDQALSCIVPIGTAGCGFEAPLESIRKALDPSNTGNAGFLRPGAYLGIIVLTDEDDCSVQDYSLFDLASPEAGPGDFRCQPLYAYDCDTPISATAAGTYTNCKVKTGSYLWDPGHYHDFLAGMKAPGQVAVTVIAGDPKSDVDMTGALSTPFVQQLALLPSCTATINGNNNIGRPGIRLNDFVQRFGDHGIFDTICQPDYSQPLVDAVSLVQRAMSPCLDGTFNTNDTDPNNPGLQPACTISDVVGLGTPQQSATPIVACPMTDPTTPSPTATKPCWWIGTNPTSCPAVPSLELHVERTAPPPAGTDVEVQCAL